MNYAKNKREIMKETVIGSPIRWAGSKKRVLNDMLILFKRGKENYVEPFLGSGVVMLNVLNNIEVLKYKNIYVNDINSNIISFYKLLKKNPLKLVKILTKLSEEYNIANDIEKEKMYYRIRDEFNSVDENKEANFYFLMKVGFNGVYRENKMGEFNVPFGRKEKLLIPVDDLIETSKLIKNVKFYNMNYDKFIKKMKKNGILKNCFMYCDPPYIGRHVDYYDSWCEDDENKLKDVLYKSNNKFMLSTWDHNEYRKNEYLEKIWCNCNKIDVEHFYHVGAKEKNRKPMIEALLTNYEVNGENNLIENVNEQLKILSFV